jgi:RpiR family carbohydrate utilization transcriptional regulator
MTTPQTLLSNLAKPAQAFSKAEQKVADAILANPELTTRSSIARLAQSAEVSEPTVNRFCKRLGATGFPDFKLKLALSLASGARFINSAVAEDDTAPTFTPKIFNASIHALEKTRDSIDPKLIHHVIDEVVASKRIYFFGQGNSGPVAQDAEFKFFRFNTPVSAHQDPLMQRMLAAASKPGDYCSSSRTPVAPLGLLKRRALRATRLPP